MSLLLDTIRVIRDWQREHDALAEIVYLSETRIRGIFDEALIRTEDHPNGRPYTPAEIEVEIRHVREGHEPPAKIYGAPLAIDDALGPDDVVPARLPRSVYTGIPDGRIVGPEGEALALRDAINDDRLQVAFVDDLATTAGARIYTAAMMAAVAVDHPVLALPAAVRAQWQAEPGPLRAEYRGPLPDAPTGPQRRFDLVSPKAPK